jgi:WD40 repeat protein
MCHVVEITAGTRSLRTERGRPAVRIQTPTLLLLQKVRRMVGGWDQMLPGLGGGLMTVEQSAGPAASAAAQAASGKLRVFISYSRDDLDFADQLDAALRLFGFETSIDRHAIAGGEEWKQRLGNLIREADTVVFVLSPSSAGSRICDWEVEEAVRFGKRIIPVVCHALESVEAPQRLRDLNFIFFYPEPKSPGSGFGVGQTQLVDALNTDLDWLREHTRLLLRATEWDVGGRTENRLLSGSDIAAAKAWAARRPKAASALTTLQLDFIRASDDAQTARDNATRRAYEERERLLKRVVRRTRLGLAGAMVLALVAGGFALFAMQQKGEANLQRHEALAQKEKAESERERAERQRNQALLTQSRFLADLGNQRITAANDAGTALALALEALPDMRNGVARPYAAEAEALLLGAHQRLKEIGVLGHGRLLNSAAFSGDGRRIVTASDDGSARIWDAATSRVLTILQGHRALVTFAAFSPDGRRVVTASADTTARIWNSETGALVASLVGHRDSVSSAAFSPDGQRIVTTSSDKTARIWNSETGEAIAVLEGHKEHVRAAAFSSDGQRIVTSSNDDTARIWNSENGQPICVLEGAAWTVAFSPDGRRVVAPSSKSTARIWNGETGKELTVLAAHTDEVRSAAFSPEGRRVVTASRDGTARVWDIESGQAIATLAGHRGAVSTAEFSPDGLRVVTASDDHTARVWDAETGKEMGVLASEGDVTAASFSPAGGRVLTVEEFEHTARVWNADMGKPKPVGEGNAHDWAAAVFTGHADVVWSAAFSPDGRRLVTASADKTARIWDRQTSKAIVTLSGHQGIVYSAAFSPDGRRIVTASGDKTARIWDAETGQSVGTLAGHTDKVLSAAFSPDGALILSSSQDGQSLLWDVATGRSVGKLLGGHAAFSPDGTQVVTANGAVVSIWETGTGRIRFRSGPLPDDVRSIAFSADGQLIAITMNQDHSVRLMNMFGLGKAPPVLTGHADIVHTAVFSPDGRRLMTASADRTARIWDVETGNEVLRVGLDAEVHGAAFSPDGQIVVTSSADGLVRLFPSSQILVDAARQAGPRCLTGQQRKKFFLDPEPLAWCIDLEKWPYQSESWKEWLKYRRAGDNPPLPNTSDWGTWVNPKYAVTYFRRGNSRLETGDLDRAIADYSEAIRLDPRFATADAAVLTKLRPSTSTPSPTLTRRSG